MNENEKGEASFEERPWGSFTILDELDNFKVKRIEVLPGKRLSYQRHQKRAEHWFVVQGTAKVTLNGNEFLVKAGEAVDISVGTAHRVENPDSSETLFLSRPRPGPTSVRTISNGLTTILDA